MICQCARNRSGGHIRVRGRAEGFPSGWYDPPHTIGTEVTGRPGVTDSEYGSTPCQVRAGIRQLPSSATRCC